MIRPEPERTEFDPARGFSSTVRLPDGFLDILHFGITSKNILRQDVPTSDFYRRRFVDAGHVAGGKELPNPPRLELREIVDFVVSMQEVVDELYQNGDPVTNEAGKLFMDARNRMIQMRQQEEDEITKRIDELSRIDSLIMGAGLLVFRANNARRGVRR